MRLSEAIDELVLEVRAEGATVETVASYRRKLKPLLSDPAPEVRWTAAAILGRLGDLTSEGALLASLEDRHSEVRAQAALSLGYLGQPTALPPLRRLAAQDESPRVREAAALSASLLDR